MKKYRLLFIAIFAIAAIVAYSPLCFAQQIPVLNTEKFTLVDPELPNVYREKSQIRDKIVKVGWFSSDGVHQVEKDGTLAGYDYDYLQAIAQYNNWEYEYHFGSFAECYDWLKTGKIDLMGIINKTSEREKNFDFSRTNAGVEQCCLFVNVDNTKFEYEDFQNFNNMTVGIEEGTVQGAMLATYAAKNHFTYKSKIYPTLNDAKVGLQKKEINALLSSNTDIVRGFKCVAQFGPIPFYFATTKGNSEVLSGVDYAMDKIMAYNPNFNNFLYGKYFNLSSSDKIVFSNEELDYIKKKPRIDVLIDHIWYPIESYNQSTKKFEGIIPTILDEISKRSGLEFNLVANDSSVEALEEISSRDATQITSITYDYKWAKENKVNITQPIISAYIYKQ